MYSKNHTFALDQLPSGSDRDMKSERVSKRLPDGITSSMLYQDILRIALPATVELMLSSLVSMMDMIMVGGLGTWAISAVGLTTQPKFILMTMSMSGIYSYRFSYGITVYRISCPCNRVRQFVSCRDKNI